MANPFDYGDPTPGDSGDTAPVDPITGLGGTSYNPSSYDPKRTPPNPGKTLFTPYTNLRNTAPPTIRDVWHGVILEYLGEDANYIYYSVVTQDGKIVTGFIYHQEYGTHYLEPETQVQLVRSRGSNNFAIIAPLLPVRDYYWCKLTEDLEEGESAQAIQYYYDIESESWTHSSAAITVHSFKQTASEDDFLQLRLIYAGDEDHEPYWEPIVGGAGGPAAPGVSFKFGITLGTHQGSFPIGDGEIQLSTPVGVTVYDMDPDGDPLKIYPLIDEDTDEPVVETWYNIMPTRIMPHKVVGSVVWKGLDIIVLESCPFIPGSQL